jgi:hypothetical protein
MQIAQRRKRRLKLGRLRKKYAAAKGSFEKDKILEKVGRLVPWLTTDEFLATMKGDDA